LYFLLFVHLVSDVPRSSTQLLATWWVCLIERLSEPDLPKAVTITISLLIDVIRASDLRHRIYGNVERMAMMAPKESTAYLIVPVLDTNW
jgi:hypothetical protein